MSSDYFFHPKVYKMQATTALVIVLLVILFFELSKASCNVEYMASEPISDSPTPISDSPTPNSLMSTSGQGMYVKYDIEVVIGKLSRGTIGFVTNYKSVSGDVGKYVVMYAKDGSKLIQTTLIRLTQGTTSLSDLLTQNKIATMQMPRELTYSIKFLTDASYEAEVKALSLQKEKLLKYKSCLDLNRGSAAKQCQL